MSLHSLPQKPCDFILFGALGSLATKKLFPALYWLVQSESLHEHTKIIACGRDKLNKSDFLGLLADNLQRQFREAFDNVVWQRLAARIDYVSMDLSQQPDYMKLSQYINSDHIPISYLATPPALFTRICEGLDCVGLAKYPARVVLEKPIGHDLASSIVLSDAISGYFDERQIFRIDHYLGKETVLNLLVLRFANVLFASNWDAKCVEQVHITLAEEVGVAGRWEYYNHYGQMRDMVQNHVLQILALITMEPPHALDANSIRDEKSKVLKALRPIDSSNISECTLRAQYDSGAIHPGYPEDGDVPSSQTETFVAIKAYIDNWRWAGVPFYLMTGKRLPKKCSEVLITFKNQPHNIFPHSFATLKPNQLRIRLQPDEGLEMHILNKKPGLNEEMQLAESILDLDLGSIHPNQRIADAYERLLLDVMHGNQSLFVRRDEVEVAWKWVDSIINAWQQQEVPLARYRAGTWGPQELFSWFLPANSEWNTNNEDE